MKETKAKVGEFVCAEYAAFILDRMVDGNSDRHRPLLIAIRMLALYGLIEVENGTWCQDSSHGKFVYAVDGSGGRVDIKVLDSPSLQPNPGIDWERVPIGRLESWPELRDCH